MWYKHVEYHGKKHKFVCSTYKILRHLSEWPGTILKHHKCKLNSGFATHRHKTTIQSLNIITNLLHHYLQSKEPL